MRHPLAVLLYGTFIALEKTRHRLVCQRLCLPFSGGPCGVKGSCGMPATKRAHEPCRASYLAVRDPPPPPVAVGPLYQTAFGPLLVSPHSSVSAVPARATAFLGFYSRESPLLWLGWSRREVTQALGWSCSKVLPYHWPGWLLGEEEAPQLAAAIAVIIQRGMVIHLLDTSSHA